MIKKLIITSMLLFGIVTVPFLSVTAIGAQESQKAFEACDANPSASVCQERGQNVLPNRIEDVINLLLYIIGIASVLVIIIGGIRYVVSGGDPSAITSAKNTIIYAVIGLVVAVLSYAIVNFVLGRF
jgi:hypothetical protein